MTTSGERSRGRWARTMWVVVATVVAVALGPVGVAGAVQGEPSPAIGGGGGGGGGGEVQYLASGVRTGDVYPIGGVQFQGSLADTGNEADVAAIAATGSGHGYWIATGDGGVHAFGDARHHGDVAHLALERPIVGMAATPDGSGYWLVASDGGVFNFGSARFHGSMGGTQLTAPVTTLITTRSGKGYWLFAEDGGVFTFGDAEFRGSLGDRPIDQRVVAGIPTTDGAGYWLAGESGAVWTFGSAPNHGQVRTAGDEPVIGIAAAPDGSGYWLATTNRPREPLYAGVPLPAGSGDGRRVVYSNSMQRVWLVDEWNRVFDSYLVSGRYGTPGPGRYAVFSKSRHAWAGHDGITMEYMVRFAWGRSLAIGFHAIPVRADGSPLQSETELGQYRSAGCVRQRVDKAQQLYEWAPIGTPVVVLG